MSTSRFPPISSLVAALTAGYPVSITGTTTKASAASATWDALTVPASTLTLTGTTHVTTATGVNLLSLAAPTITDASAVTVDTAATFYIGGSPVAAGSVTLTTGLSLWVDSGISRFDGNVIVGVYVEAVAQANAFTVRNSGNQTVAFNSTTANTSRVDVGNSAINLSLQVTSGGTGDIFTGGATAHITLKPNGVEKMRLTVAGNVVVGTAALTTGATDGFLYIPSCAGTPSGTPTAFTGCVPMVYDTTNHKFYIFDGSWRGGTTPGAFT